AVTAAGLTAGLSAAGAPLVGSDTGRLQEVAAADPEVPAKKEPSDGAPLSPGDQAIQDAQYALMQLFEQVSAQFADSPNWAGAELNTNERAVTLYWVGTPPEGLQQ